jgi:hypothetical protein
MKNIQEKCLKWKQYTQNTTKFWYAKNTEMRSREATCPSHPETATLKKKNTSIASQWALEVYMLLRRGILYNFTFFMTIRVSRTIRKYGRNKLQLLSSKQENDGKIS